jgi:hypothetical protein
MAKKHPTPDDTAQMIEEAVKATISAVPEGGLFLRVRIKAHKIRTSQGRRIEGDVVDMPRDEALELISSGDAETC